MLELNVNWRASAVNPAVAGLTNVPRPRTEFPNISSFADLPFLLYREKVRNPVGQIGLLSYLPPIRLQSEAFPMIRAHSNDLALTTTPSSTKSALWLVSNRGGGGQLALKMASRKRTRGAATLLRPCFCPPGGLVPSYLLPIHAMRPGLLRSRFRDIRYPRPCNARISVDFGRIPSLTRASISEVTIPPTASAEERRTKYPNQGLV